MNDPTEQYNSGDRPPHETPGGSTIGSTLDDQRRRWQTGDRVRVEKYLEQQPTLADDREALLDLIYNEVILRQSRGEAPTLAEYQERFPALAAELQVQFEIDQELQPGQFFDPHTRSDTVITPGSGPAPPGSRPRTIAGYTLGKKLGQGGMGSVYEAAETGSGRRVAMKLVSPQVGFSDEALERFRREGKLAGMLAHPRCVFVLAADEEAGQPYIIMELMPGDTLSDLVAREGPLPVEKALALIFDVIEGLQEAHRLGLIHRDVKPSNCFLTRDGRVKVGDFGLAKVLLFDEPPSLTGGPNAAAAGDTTQVSRPSPPRDHLTGTGIFLGTPLYAAPEQLRVETLDVRADVYSVAATLFYLLTGQAPRQESKISTPTGDLSASPPPTMRRLRPELSRALDHVVQRGLRPDREGRWKDLEALRSALLRFAPGTLSLAGVGLRLTAYLIDFVILVAVLLPIEPFFIFSEAEKESPVPRSSVSILVAFFFGLFYFGLTEALWGASPGKWVLRLRVTTEKNVDMPGYRDIAVRTLAFQGMMFSSDLALPVLALLIPMSSTTRDLIGGVWGFLVLVLLLGTMRARTGYRGIHEWLSGTRVVRLPATVTRRSLTTAGPSRLEQHLLVSPVLPDQVGPFPVRGTLYQHQNRQILLGEDRPLKRLTLLVRDESPALSAERRQLDRPGRLHWLAGGQAEGNHWDAFALPDGNLLADLVAPGRSLAWHEVRLCLLQLTRELAAACADGTLPRVLTPGQVWVQTNGNVVLLDTPVLHNSGGEEGTGADEERCFSFLCAVAALALEGQARPPGELGQPARAPLAGDVRKVLDRLFRTGGGYATLEEFHKALSAVSTEELDRTKRGLHLAAMAFSHFPLFVLWSAFFFEMMRVETTFQETNRLSVGELFTTEVMTLIANLGFIFLLLLVILSPVLVWNWCTRGGWFRHWMGLALVRADGRPAARWQCVWREILFWMPVLVPLAVGLTLSYVAVALRPAAAVFYGLSVAVLLAYIPLAMWNPPRSWHDRLAGTWLVPR